MPFIEHATGLVPGEAPDAFCQACRLNRTIPRLGPPEHLLRWQRLEAAKHQLVYNLLHLGLPLVSKFEDPGTGLAFDFLADPVPGSPDGPKILTGHEQGLITINLAEADDAECERARTGDGRALPHPARALPPRGRSLLLGAAGLGRAAPGVVSHDVR